MKKLISATAALLKNGEKLQALRRQADPSFGTSQDAVLEILSMSKPDAVLLQPEALHLIVIMSCKK